MRKFVRNVMIIVVALIAIFLLGRFGWKLGGFRACQSAGIESVEVSEDAVHIIGFYPGSFPEGFCGYYAKEQDGKLYVGFKFSAIFGFFETGDFDITIPVKGDIQEVIVKTNNNENSVWTAENGCIVQSEQYGVYVKLERNDIDSVSMSYGSFSNGAIHADSTAWEGGEYIFMDNDIMYISKDAGAPVLFSITAKQKDGKVVASGNFSFDANQEKMYLTITADGTIVDDTEGYVPDPEEKPTTMEAYATVIGEYYTALSEGWDAAQVMESGLNYMVADSFFENPLEEIGYMVSDLDGDGAQELIIGSMKEDEFFGKMIFSLYTLDGSGVPQLLIDSTERNRYYYAGDIKFANLGSSDWNASFVTTLKLENKELIDMTYTTNPTDYVQMELTSFSRWGE